MEVDISQMWHAVNNLDNQKYFWLEVLFVHFGKRSRFFSYCYKISRFKINTSLVNFSPETIHFCQPE